SPVTPDLAPAAPQDAARASEQPVGRQQAAIPQAAPPVGRPESFGFQDQPLYPDSPQTVTTELVAKLNEATAQFNLAAQRLEAASQHMDQAVAKLDEAIRRFDDSSWDNNHQETLF
ncbi:MAG: ribonuclease HI, partial [Parascardovia denticolens]